MHRTKHINPLDSSALTVDSVEVGDRIVCKTPLDEHSAQILVIINDPYTNEDGDCVIEVRHYDGHVTTELTSSLGLTGDRFNGEWRVIAFREVENG